MKYIKTTEKDNQKKKKKKKTKSYDYPATKLTNVVY